MAQEKICPLMVSSYLSNPNISVKMIIGNEINAKNIEHLPKCLKELCGAWVEEGRNFSNVPMGYCGLRD